MCVFQLVKSKFKLIQCVFAWACVCVTVLMSVDACVLVGICVSVHVCFCVQKKLKAVLIREATHGYKLAR